MDTPIKEIKVHYSHLIHFISEILGGSLLLMIGKIIDQEGNNFLEGRLP